MRNIFKRKPKKIIPRQYSFVVFDRTTVPLEMYEKYYKETFQNSFNTSDKLFIFLGEVPNARSHCILADLVTGTVEGIYHTYNFREATEDEC